MNKIKDNENFQVTSFFDQMKTEMDQFEANFKKYNSKVRSQKRHKESMLIKKQMSIENPLNKEDTLNLLSSSSFGKLMNKATIAR